MPSSSLLRQQENSSSAGADELLFTCTATYIAMGWFIHIQKFRVFFWMWQAAYSVGVNRRCPAFLPHWSQMVTVSRCCSQWNLQKIRLITGSPATSLLKKVTIITIHKENVAIPQAQERYHHHHHLNFQRVNMGKSTISIRAIETIANCNKLLEAMRYD